MIRFEGKVSTRTAKQPGGPPGETEIINLNPQRLKLILDKTGWSQLFPGTMNILVPKNCILRSEYYMTAADAILLEKPLIQELGSTIKYPPSFQWITELRVGYLYYPAIIENDIYQQKALIRRTCNNRGIDSILEAFAPIKLREALHVSDGDIVVCKVGYDSV